MSPKTPKMFQCTRCKNSYVYKNVLTRHIMTKHPLPGQAKKNVNINDNIFHGDESSDTIGLLVEALQDGELYDTGALASQKTKSNDNNDIINDILSEIVKIVSCDKIDTVDETAMKTAIVPDKGWTKNTTDDLASLLNNIVVDPNPFECPECDKRFMSKEEMDQHDATKHNIEEDRLDAINSVVSQYDYDLLYRKHQKMEDRNLILTRANQNRLEILQENERLRQANSSNELNLQEALKQCQILEDAIKIRDMDIKAKAKRLAAMDENEKNINNVVEEQIISIKALREELGIPEEDDDLGDNDVQLDDGLTEEETELLTEETRRHNQPQKKCKKCNFSTNNQTIMKGHMTCHREYTCSQCNKNFDTEWNLKNHTNREHKRDLHSCTKCQKQFPSTNSLKQHMNAQHKTVPPVGHPQWALERNAAQTLDYTCNQCNDAFETLKEIREHKITKHKGESFTGFREITKLCHFFKQGRCDINPCRYSHQQHQHQQQQQQV